MITLSDCVYIFFLAILLIMSCGIAVSSVFYICLAIVIYPKYFLYFVLGFLIFKVIQIHRIKL